MASNVTRRTVLAGGLAGGLGSLIPFPEWFAANAQGPVKVRYAAQSPQGQAMVAKYATAVQAMMGRPLGNPCGWTYQWYVHQIRSDTTKAAAIATLPVAQRALPNEMWNTCQAHFGRPLQYFLPWHRMYVYFLERIVRQACGDPNFTLPYWDYMDPTQRALPASFRANPSPLFRPNRDPAVNAGSAIDQGYPPDTINLNCMGQPDYASFNSAINGNPHGVVHGLVGNGQGMGSVPWAGNDSIFYFHHCNIDRYWASWNTRYPNPSDPAWGDQQFVFADENCQRVLVKVRDFQSLTNLGYRYDKLYRMPLTGLAAGLARLKLLAVYRPLRVGPNPDPGPLRIKLGNAPTTLQLVTADTKAPLATSLRMAAASRSVVLSVKNLRTTLPLDTIYLVYVNLPKGVTGERANAYFAGAISFFDAVAMDHKAMGHADMDMGGEGPSFDLDITALVKRLGPQADINVTIVPKGRVQPDADVSVGGIELRAG